MKKNKLVQCENCTYNCGEKCNKVVAVGYCKKDRPTFIFLDPASDNKEGNCKYFKQKTFWFNLLNLFRKTKCAYYED